jgi:hypothetical protein
MARRFLGSLKRRDFVVSLGAAGGALLGVFSNQARAHAAGHAPHQPARPAVTPTGAPAAPVLAPELAALFGPLTAGAQVERWRIVTVRGPQFGAIGVVLTGADGVQFQVDVLRRDRTPGAPPGVGHTPSLTCFLANRGDGSTATAEEQGLGAIALAAALSERELSGAPVPALLLTLRERNRRYPSGLFAVEV